MRSGEYRVDFGEPRQTIWGFGVEIQSDSIGSGNLGLPEKPSGVPHDLVESERDRLYEELLDGFRYVRLAMGLYLRGTTDDEKHVVERYDGQMDDLAELFERSGAEGASVEYWSPPPHWKDTDQYRGGRLERFDDDFLEEFGDALVRDLDYLTDNDIPVSMWSLQNEPPVDHGKYSTCAYTPEQYYETFRHVAPKIRDHYPDVFIHANSMSGQYGRGSERIRADPEALECVDGWSWHKIGTDANDQIDNDYTGDAAGRPVFNNEFEYFPGTPRGFWMVNTAQSITNWLTFQNAPTWFWLHALKPTYNEESEGFGLGLWRPHDDEDTAYPDIEPGHFEYVTENWHAVRGFVEHIPWDSTRYHVHEDVVRYDNRIMAWESPDGKLGVVVTNRSGEPFRCELDLGRAARFHGQRYTVDEVVPQTVAVGPEFAVTIPDGTIEFWIED